MTESKRCPWCGAVPLVVVEVHGHGQCASCGTNIDPCCGGETCEADAQSRLDEARDMHRDSGCGCE